MMRLLSLAAVCFGLFVIFFERGPKPLRYVGLVHRLEDAGILVEPLDSLELTREQEALLPEQPKRLFTGRFIHPELGISKITAAAFHRERVPRWLEEQLEGFASRNWFFFGPVKASVKEAIAKALEIRTGDVAFRLRERKKTLKPMAWQGISGAKRRPQEELLSRQQVLGRIAAAGLEINRVVRKREMPASIRKALPAEPKENFLLIVEDEGIYPIQFTTVEQAIAMQKVHKKGFRQGNWYFPGQVSEVLRKKLTQALDSRPGPSGGG